MDKLKPVLSQAKDNIHLFGQDTDYGLNKFRFKYPKVGNMEAERKYSSSFFLGFY
jgi:hypothetical protein